MASSTGYNKYVIKQYSQLEYLHGGVGYVDAERILIKEGFQKTLHSHERREAAGVF